MLIRQTFYTFRQTEADITAVLLLRAIFRTIMNSEQNCNEESELAEGMRQKTRKEVLSSDDLHQPNSSLKCQFAQVLRQRYFTLKGWKPPEKKRQIINFATLL